MSRLEDYINRKYGGDVLWFKKEITNNTKNRERVTETVKLKRYLDGVHKVLTREDVSFKDQTFYSKKLILNNAKTILNFHNTYLLGNDINLTGDEASVDLLESVWKSGKFYNRDYNILDMLNKYGDVWEYVYKDENGNVTSKILTPETYYPICVCDDFDFVGGIDFWEYDNVKYYDIYFEDKVQHWVEDELIETYNNPSGLPIWYHGESLLKNIKPVLDEIEDLLSKMGDAIYTLSLNPLLFTTGQAIDSTVSSDAVGYNVAFENGSTMEYVSSTMDYSCIKYYLDTLQNELNMISYIPSILGGSGNIANVSEVSLKMLYQLADVYAMLSEKIMREGMFERIDKICKLDGLKIGEVNINFNYSRPQNQTELLDNLKKQFDMMAISTRTIIEKSPLTTDVSQEEARINGGIDSLE